MPSTTDNRSREVAVFVAALGVLIGVFIGLGELITHPLAHDWPITAEDGVDRTFAAHRTPTWNSVTGFFSTAASTPYAIAATALVTLITWLVFRRWREPVFIAGVVAVEATVFLLTTLVVSRARPTVPALDKAPPTSSFPSGHTAAAMALYGGIALLAMRFWRKWPVWLVVLIPLAVGTSRLYRGMHHPTDVIAGLLLGTACLLLMHRTVLGTPPPPRSRPLAQNATTGSRA